MRDAGVQRLAAAVVILVALAFHGPAGAAGVAEDQALAAAKRFFIDSGPAVSLGSATFDLALSFGSGDGADLFLFSGPGGFVWVSGDDSTDPIVAYSFEDRCDSPGGVPPAMAILEGYGRQIAHIKSKAAAALAGGSRRAPAVTAATAQAGPLLNSVWNQSPFYNDQCPEYGGQHAVAGCTAIAIAQIMKYHHAPARGSGSYCYDSYNYGALCSSFEDHAYNWAEMADKVSSRNDAVATLVYDVGVSVDMEYGIPPDGSGAPISTAESSLPSYFGYRGYVDGLTSGIRFLERADFDDAAWISMIKADLDRKLPILYAGYGSSYGHAFVLDGYDTSDKVHVNWGWGGACNGWFRIDSLSPICAGESFNFWEQAVMGIEPEVCNPVCGDHNCGDDGCGGSCGTCGEGLSCKDGRCCACTSGPCSDGCNCYPDNALCALDAAEEFRCSGTGCGGSLQKRTQNRYCSGKSPGCDGKTSWNSWKTLSTCAISQVCDLGEEQTAPSCRSCENGCEDGACRAATEQPGGGCSAAGLTV